MYRDPDKIIQLLPAYGRKYESKEQLLKDWTAGKDFQIWQGPYCSIRDREKMREQGYEKVLIAAINPHGSQPLLVEITIQ